MCSPFISLAASTQTNQAHTTRESTRRLKNAFAGTKVTQHLQATCQKPGVSKPWETHGLPVLSSLKLLGLQIRTRKISCTPDVLWRSSPVSSQQSGSTMPASTITLSYPVDCRASDTQGGKGEVSDSSSLECLLCPLPETLPALSQDF